MEEQTSEEIVIAANFTIEPLKDSLSCLLAKMSRRSKPVFAPYNQVFQQLSDPSGLFHKNRRGANVTFLRVEDLIESRGQSTQWLRQQIGKITANADELVRSFRAAEHFAVPLFVFICPLSAAIAADTSLAHQFEAIANSISWQVESFSNLFVFGTSPIASRYEITEVDNPKGNALGHVPYTASFVSALAVETVRKIDAYERKPFKVLVVDCDNTLWDGIVGEDGVEGIRLSESRLFLQKFAVEQSESGMLVCLVSRNNEGDVWEVFEKRNDMVLTPDHIVASRINWLPKSQNLKSIADELQLGLDSFVFIDDDPAVCDEVKRNCPEVLTIVLPGESEDLESFFDHLWVFDRLKVTKEDRERSGSYKAQALRRKELARAADMSEFLASLELVCEISALTEHDVSRVSQLTLRTNQFNSTTVRLSEADVTKRLSEADRSIWTIRVRDRFGDYGLVGVVIFNVLDKALIVEAFMLSCRVLGRGVEHQIVKRLGEKAIELGLEDLVFEFAPTKKNIPVLSFLEEIGERSEIAGQASYEVSSRVAVECAPRSIREEFESPRADAGSMSIASTTQVTNSNRSAEIYVEIAHALATKGISMLDSSVEDLSRVDLQSEFQAARTSTETELVQIWERALRISNIGIADNFFDIGGSSLVAVDIFVQIEEHLGRSLPISTLLDAPTIEKLAEVIDLGSEPRSWKYLVPVQPEGSQPPLFCMHAAGGSVLFYRDLANGLGTDQPVYGLQARGISDRSETAHDRVEEMAAEYLEEICRFQPHGPYRLCGSSFGGLVAVECARQLQARGKEVSLLAVFDTYAPGYLSANLSKPGPLSFVHRSIDRLRNTANQLRDIKTGHGKIEFVVDRIDRLKNRQKRRILWRTNEIAIQYKKATGRELPNDLGRNHKAIQRAELSYLAGSYDGQLVLLRASNQPSNITFDPLLGWGRFIRQGIVAEEVRGIHGAIAVYPSAAELAQKLSRYLDESRTEAHPDSLGSHVEVKAVESLAVGTGSKNL